ncbi:MAG: hypothetical protein QXE51_01045 [Nitrososphaeria archaeon]
MKAICFFPLGDGVGVLLEEDYEKEADLYLKERGSLEKSLRFEPDETGNICFFINDTGIILESKVFSSLLKNPNLYLFFKRNNSNFAEEIVKVELNRDNLLRLEGMFLYVLNLRQ